MKKKTTFLCPSSLKIEFTDKEELPSADWLSEPLCKWLKSWPLPHPYVEFPTPWGEPLLLVAVGQYTSGGTREATDGVSFKAHGVRINGIPYEFNGIVCRTPPTGREEPGATASWVGLSHLSMKRLDRESWFDSTEKVTDNARAAAYGFLREQVATWLESRNGQLFRAHGDKVGLQEKFESAKAEVKELRQEITRKQAGLGKIEAEIVKAATRVVAMERLQ